MSQRSAKSRAPKKTLSSRELELHHHLYHERKLTEEQIYRSFSKKIEEEEKRYYAKAYKEFGMKYIRAFKILNDLRKEALSSPTISISRRIEHYEDILFDLEKEAKEYVINGSDHHCISYDNYQPIGSPYSCARGLFSRRRCCICYLFLFLFGMQRRRR